MSLYFFAGASNSRGDEETKSTNASDYIASLLHMALFKRCKMAKEVYLQRVWRWERSLHPDPANYGDSSMTRRGVLFGLS